MVQWLPAGKERNGRWYVGDFDGAPGKSANVDMRTGTWFDNGRKDDKGGDLISLYARLKGIDNGQAARELLEDNGWQTMPVVQAPAKRKQGVDWVPIHPVPANAPEYRTQWAHFARGIPKAHWEYRDAAGALLGLACRFEKSDGTKDVQPLSYCQGSNGVRMWRYKAFGQPRPLYGLDKLARFAGAPDVPAIVVEGEKKADKLWEALGQSMPVIGWPGGCKVPHLADWSPLAGRRVVCWPDADAQVDDETQQMLPIDEQPGMLAMLKVQQLLTAHGCRVRIVDIGAPGERESGWDCADAIDEGMDREALLSFMRRLVPLPAQPEDHAESHQASGGSGGGSTPQAAARSSGEDGDWRARLIWRKGEPRECVPNVMLVLSAHAEWYGVLAFDEFSQRVVKRRPAPYDAPDIEIPGEWRDVDDTRAAAWIARNEGFVPNSGMVAEAANEVAHSNPYHPVLDWLEMLKHDGIERLDSWIIDLMGVRDTPYVRLVSRYFLIGMCKRVLEPGCKFDYCLVLEGPQGRRKSSALRILGGEWFSDIELDLQNKDSMSNIRGKWLHEFGEMGSLARAESNRQKSFLSRQIDEFRPVYGRREIRCKRQSVFAGSTNEWAWNKDPTGGRRFWSVEVSDEIDTVALQAVRDQLFAEAYAAAKAGVRFWPDADEQRDLFDPEQLARETPDAYVEMIAAWLASDIMVQSEFTLTDACVSGLKLDAKSMTKDVQTRVGIALRKLGCERVEHRNAINRFVYKRPPRNAASSKPSVATVDDDEEVPF